MDRRVLVLCYGNPGRLDDGLGPAFGEALERAAVPGITVDIDYQLTVEDAALAAEHDVVVFADAAVRGRTPFFFDRVVPRASLGFSSHGAEPEALLALAGALKGAPPEGFALGIRGYEFDEFGETLSPGAATNLDAALQCMLPVLSGRSFDEAVASFADDHGDPTPRNGDQRCEMAST